MNICSATTDLSCESLELFICKASLRPNSLLLFSDVADICNKV